MSKQYRAIAGPLLDRVGDHWLGPLSRGTALRDELAASGGLRSLP